MSESDMFKWYKKLYPDVENSVTYSKYCNLAFGKDLSQQGFSDIEQIDYMLSKLNINAASEVLDIGCGTGKLAEYIYGLTGARITGIDYSPTAIQIAKQRNSQGTFVCRNMDDVDYPANSFDIIFTIDAIFFSADLPKLLSKLNTLLKNNGKLAVYYSEIRFDENVSVDVLQPKNTLIGKAFEDTGLNYEVFDLTDNLYRHMLLKRKTALALKDEFVFDNKEYLFDYIYRESIPEDMSLSVFKNFQARYLYIHEK